MSDHDPSGRVAAFSAVVTLAIEEANTDSRRRWRADISREDVERETEQDVSSRTVHRAMKDAAALGWLKDMSQGWNPGPRAEEFEQAPEIPVDED